MCRLPRPAVAGLALAVLLGGLTLPVVSLVLADELAPFCCGRGRCCCAGDTSPADDRTCLRRGCGCERKDATADMEPLSLEAVLPVVSPLVRPESGPPERDVARGSVLTRPHAPPIPPPRRSLPA